MRQAVLCLSWVAMVMSCDDPSELTEVRVELVQPEDVQLGTVALTGTAHGKLRLVAKGHAAGRVRGLVIESSATELTFALPTDAVSPGVPLVIPVTWTPSSSGLLDATLTVTARAPVASFSVRVVGEAYVLDCEDHNDCTSDSVASGACVNTAITAPCDDGSACTSNDQCVSGVCTGEAESCDDGDPCTDDACGEAACENPPIACGDPNALCTTAYCDSVLGCVEEPVPNGTSCGEAVCGLLHACVEGTCRALDVTIDCAPPCGPGCPAGYTCGEGDCTGGNPLEIALDVRTVHVTGEVLADTTLDDLPCETGSVMLEQPGTFSDFFFVAECDEPGRWTFEGEVYPGLYRGTLRVAGASVALNRIVVPNEDVAVQLEAIETTVLGRVRFVTANGGPASPDCTVNMGALEWVSRSVSRSFLVTLACPTGSESPFVLPLYADLYDVTFRPFPGVTPGVLVSNSDGARVTGSDAPFVFVSRDTRGRVSGVVTQLDGDSQVVTQVSVRVGGVVTEATLDGDAWRFALMAPAGVHDAWVRTGTSGGPEDDGWFRVLRGLGVVAGDVLANVALTLPEVRERVVTMAVNGEAIGDECPGYGVVVSSDQGFFASCEDDVTPHALPSGLHVFDIQVWPDVGDFYTLRQTVEVLSGATELVVDFERIQIVGSLTRNGDAGPLTTSVSPYLELYDPTGELPTVTAYAQLNAGAAPTYDLYASPGTYQALVRNVAEQWDASAFSYSVVNQSVEVTDDAVVDIDLPVRHVAGRVTWNGATPLGDPDGGAVYFIGQLVQPPIPRTGNLRWVHAGLGLHRDQETGEVVFSGEIPAGVYDVQIAGSTSLGVPYERFTAVRNLVVSAP